MNRTKTHYRFKPFSASFNIYAGFAHVISMKNNMKTALFFYFIFSALFWYNNNLFSQSITAKYNKHIVDSLMNTINPNAKLHWLTSDSVLINGTSLLWNYQYGYFSEDTHTNYFLHTTFDSAIYDSLNHLAPLGIMYIDSLWIDSDSALVLAENQGGIEFRNNHTNFKIIASLGKPLVPNSTNRWYINYISLDDPLDKLFINLDATEDTISNIGKFEILPTDLVLYQNYPNPFNSITNIRFSIPKEGFVELKIYDLLGSEIRTMIQEFKSAGSYNVYFGGSKLVGGIYFYKLKFGSSTQTKKLLLIK